MSNIDSFGHYNVGEKKFYSKILACIYATENKLPRSSLEWHFNEDTYDTTDWEIEPEESLDQLYELRAREIRAQYDYVIISYSGGADSHNVLMSFIRAGLHVDELVIHMFEKGMGGFDHLDKSDIGTTNAMSTDYVFHTVPMLKEIKNRIPKTKITIVDQSDEFEDFFTNAKDESWVLNRTEFLGVGNVVKYNYLKDIRKTVEKTKSMVVILGTDKPRVYIRDDGYLYFVLTDKGINSGKSVIDNLSVYDNLYVELFYWGATTTCVSLLKKQSHVIAKWLSANPKYQPFFLAENNAKGSKTVFRIIHERVLRDVIYSIWNNNWFQAEKSVYEWHNEIDRWYFKNKKLTDGEAIWREGLSYVAKHAAPFVNKIISTADVSADGLIVLTKVKKIASVQVSPIARSTNFGFNWSNDEKILKRLLKEYLV